MKFRSIRKRKLIANARNKKNQRIRRSTLSNPPVRDLRTRSTVRLRSSGSPSGSSESVGFSGKEFGRVLRADSQKEDFGRVSRAGQKLADANEAFRVDFGGKIVLDLGSSTGGFTEYALSFGAARVVAVEVGTGQMKAPLRFNPKIELHEKTDLLGFSLASGEKPDVVVADVSWVSMRKVLGRVRAEFLKSGTKVLAMFKPQFEAKRFQLKDGVVKNNKMRREIIKDFENWLRDNNWKIVAKRDNEVAGMNGNVERFYYLVAEPRP